MKDILLIWYSSLTAFFLTLEMSVQIHCFWPPVSDQKSAVSLTEDPRYMLSQFSLAALEILFIIRFQTFEFPYASLWVYLTWSSLRFLGVYVTVSQQLFSHYFLKTFLLLFFSFPSHSSTMCVFCNTRHGLSSSVHCNHFISSALTQWFPRPYLQGHWFLCFEFILEFLKALWLTAPELGLCLTTDMYLLFIHPFLDLWMFSTRSLDIFKTTALKS